jgi:hypothetical protein
MLPAEVLEPLQDETFRSSVERFYAVKEGWLLSQSRSRELCKQVQAKKCSCVDSYTAHAAVCREMIGQIAVLGESIAHMSEDSIDTQLLAQAERQLELIRLSLDTIEQSLNKGHSILAK